jgi:hypothetical protein
MPRMPPSSSDRTQIRAATGLRGPQPSVRARLPCPRWVSTCVVVVASSSIGVDVSAAVVGVSAASVVVVSPLPQPATAAVSAISRATAIVPTYRVLRTVSLSLILIPAIQPLCSTHQVGLGRVPKFADGPTSFHQARPPHLLMTPVGEGGGQPEQPRPPGHQVPLVLGGPPVAGDAAVLVPAVDGCLPSDLRCTIVR